MNRHLVFRCARCRATTSVDAEWNDERPAHVSCGICAAEYALAADRDRGASDEAYHERVRRYASEHRIDLASAYSVVEGILPREKVRTLPAGSPEIPRGASSAARPVALLALLILVLGFLARELRLTEAATAAPGGGATAALAGAPERVKIIPVAYQVDGEGRLTKVSATDPRTVLVAFCQHESNGMTLQPVSIAPGQPPGNERRTGIVRETGPASSFAWVSMARDARTGLWTIGEGTAPVAIERGRELPPGAELLTF